MQSKEFNEALSVLNKIDAENKVWEAQNTGRLQIRKVIEAFMIANKGLEELEAHKRTLEESIARLGPRYDQENAALRATLQKTKVEYDEEVKKAHARVVEARTELAAVEKNLVEQTEAAEKILETFKQQTTAARAELATLNKSIDTLKRKHGLVNVT